MNTLNKEWKRTEPSEKSHKDFENIKTMLKVNINLMKKNIKKNKRKNL